MPESCVPFMRAPGVGGETVAGTMTAVSAKIFVAKHQLSPMYPLNHRNC